MQVIRSCLITHLIITLSLIISYLFFYSCSPNRWSPHYYSFFSHFLYSYSLLSFFALLFFTLFFHSCSPNHWSPYYCSFFSLFFDSYSPHLSLHRYFLPFFIFYFLFSCSPNYSLFKRFKWTPWLQKNIKLYI